jgi:serine/threonine-protein kinase
VASVATAQEDEASVKTEQNKQPPRRGAVKKAAALIIPCTLACTGPASAVREGPEPVTAAPCPPGAVDAMKKLGVKINGRTAIVEMVGVDRDGDWAKVNEGWVKSRLGQSYTGLKVGTFLSGRLIFGKEEAWAHFTQATTPDGKTYPVCIEGRTSRDLERYEERFVWMGMRVQAVDEFK